MFTIDKGRPIAKFITGKNRDKLTLKLLEDGDTNSKILGQDIEFTSKIIPIPNDETRIYYIAGPSGSGKSTMASQILQSYKKQNPKNDIYIFSRKDKDEVLDKLNPYRIEINNDLIENPLDITKEVEKGGCCFLFDDYNTIQDKELRNAVSKIMNDILEIGRSYKVSCIITNHLINGDNKKDMRTIFNEAHNITIFPKCGNKYGMRYMLEKYMGFDKRTINRILNLNSRWCTMSKTYPNYVLYENGAFIP